MHDITRVLLVGVEVLLIISPITWLFWKKGRGLDSFHPLVVFPIAFSVFYLLPNIYYLFFSDYYLFTDKVFAYTLLLWVNAALVFFYLGYFVASKLKFSIKNYFRDDIKEKFAPWIFIALGLIALVSFTVFIYITGGLQYYITHLNDTINLTSGKVYWIWGILLFRTAFLFSFLYILQMVKQKYLSKKTGALVLIIQGLITVTLLFIIGARILILSFLIETIVFIHYSIKKINCAYLTGITLVLFAVVVIGIGAWRNYGWIADHTNKSFCKYIVSDTTQNFGARVFNNYFDSVKNFGFSLKYTDHGLPVQWGRTYLAIFVQPIPNSYRPGLRLPFGPEMNGIYCGSPKGGDYCGIDPLLGELYQNFKYFGIPLGLFIFGFMSNIIYRYLIKDVRSNNFSYILYGVYVYATFFWLRGAFVGHTSFILMDIIPLLFLQIFFKNKSAKEG